MKSFPLASGRWTTAVLLTATALLGFSNVHAQSGAAALFEGRPAMSGAQGGLGAQGGMAQGGIGVQGADAAQRTLNLRKPSGLEAPSMPQGKIETPSGDIVAKSNTDTALGRDNAIAKEERGVVKKARRGVKNTVNRARHGVTSIDAKATAELKP